MSKKQRNKRMNHYTSKKIVKREFRKLSELLKQLNNNISTIHDEGTNEDNYRTAFNTIQNLKNALDTINEFNLSVGYRNRYYRELDYFKARYGHLKRITHDYWVENIK